MRQEVVLPFDIGGQVSMGQLDLWSRAYAADAEARAAAAKEAEMLARRAGNAEATARAMCDQQRAATVSLAPMAAFALRQAGVPAETAVYDSYWFESDAIEAWRREQPGLLQSAGSWLTQKFFPKAYVPSETPPRPTRTELCRGWLIDTQIVEGYVHYVRYEAQLGLVLVDTHAGNKVPGYFAVAQYQNNRDEGSDSDEMQLRMVSRSSIHPVPDDNLRSDVYRGMFVDHPYIPFDQTDDLIHMYTGQLRRHTRMQDCSPWSAYNDRPDRFRRYHEWGVEPIAQEAVRAYLIQQGLSPESVYGWRAGHEALGPQDTLPNGRFAIDGTDT